jgi:histone H3/H4
MKRVLKHTLARLVRDIGYERAEERAVEVFMSALEKYMVNYLKSVVSFSRHALKSRATFLDILRFVKQGKVEVHKMAPLLYDPEVAAEDPAFASPLASSTEKYIHIYEFMPSFPPTHTFRQTIVKPNGRDTRSFDVKHRLEQSLRTENNLLRLIKASGALPPFVNFLYKHGR